MAYTNMHRLFNVRPNQWFKIKWKSGMDSNECYIIDEDGDLLIVEEYTRCIRGIECSSVLSYAINNPESIVYLTPLYFTSLGMKVPEQNK